MKTTNMRVIRAILLFFFVSLTTISFAQHNLTKEADEAYEDQQFFQRCRSLQASFFKRIEEGFENKNHFTGLVNVIVFFSITSKQKSGMKRPKGLSTMILNWN